MAFVNWEESNHYYLPWWTGNTKYTVFSVFKRSKKDQRSWGELKTATQQTFCGTSWKHFQTDTIVFWQCLRAKYTFLFSAIGTSMDFLHNRISFLPKIWMYLLQRRHWSICFLKHGPCLHRTTWIHMAKWSIFDQFTINFQTKLSNASWLKMHRNQTEHNWVTIENAEI